MWNVRWRIRQLIAVAVWYWARCTLSVKLSDFAVWRHTWWKNWKNCAVLTGNSAGHRTVLSSRLSHRELRSSLRESHSFLTLPADTTMASSQGTSVSSNSFSRWTSHDIFLWNITSCSTFYAFFSSFRITLWPTWLANSKRQPWFYPPQSHAQEDTQNWQKNWETWWETCALPENIQFSFSYSFLHS
jgi:hypothetical protein